MHRCHLTAAWDEPRLSIGGRVELPAPQQAARGCTTGPLEHTMERCSLTTEANRGGDLLGTYRVMACRAQPVAGSDVSG